MKKIFTFALAAFAALSMSAMETVTVWEGELLDPNWAESSVASSAVVKMVNLHRIVEGSQFKLYGYRTDGYGEGQYCKIAVIDGSWTSLIDGSTGENRTCLYFNDSLAYVNNELQCDSFTVNATTLPLMSGAFKITGHGFKLTKITVTAEEGDPEVIVTDLETSLVLWQTELDEEGDPVSIIDGWGASVVDIDSSMVAPFAAAYTRVANMYILVDNIYGGQNLRISGDWGDWGPTALPADGYNHLDNIEMISDEMGIVKVELKQDWMAQAFATTGGGFTLWGAGNIYVKAIGTTKAALQELVPTALRDVKLMENGIRYNMMGQQVGEDYHGIVILNGKKMLQ